MPETLNVYLHEDGAEQFIDDYESRHGELVAASTNYEQLAKSEQSLYAGVMSVAAGAAYAFMPQVMGSIFSMLGAMRHHFEVPMIVLMACVVLLALMSFAMSMALMRPVKRIMVYSLLKE